jgi:tetratricopeptide (TPR) repeat protein
MHTFAGRWFGAGAGALMLLSSAGVAAESAARTRAVMRDVFEAIAYLLPLSLKDPDPSSPTGDPELLKGKLDVLTRSAKDLVAHTGKSEAEFGLLARSFERSVADIRAGFDAEYPAFAYFGLMDLTQHCAACHARLPDAGNNDLGQRLLARIDVDALAREDLARLYVATRQFDAALSLYERILLDTGTNPIDTDLAGTFVDYLQVVIGVEQDLARARTFIGQYRARADLPIYLRQRTERWLQRIDAVGDALRAAPTLVAGQRQFDLATGITPTPAGRERAIDDLVAASILRRYLLDNPAAPGADRAQAYYLLALIALRTTEMKPAVPELELLLEAAIRAAPKGPHARDAYVMLEEYGFVDDALLGRGEVRASFLDMAALRKLVGW